MYAGQKGHIQNFGWETQGKETTWKTWVLDRRIILKFILKEWGRMDGIDLAQDRDRWQALVNAVMNLWVP
jgi:hypothetical protein